MKRHTAQVTFFLPPKDKAAAKKAAIAARRPLSEWLRIVVEEALKASVEKKSA